MIDDEYDAKVAVRLCTNPVSMRDAVKLTVDRPHVWSVQEVPPSIPSICFLASKLCVTCPVCTFSFDMDHKDEPSGETYTCPQCECAVLKLDIVNLKSDVEVFKAQRDGMVEQVKIEEGRIEKARARMFEEHQAVLRRARLAYEATSLLAAEQQRCARAERELGELTRVLLEVFYAGCEREMPTDPNDLAEDLRRRMVPARSKEVQGG